MLNGLQACQQHFSSPKQFVTDSVKAEEDVKSVTEELQRQYEKCFHAVKNFASKSVKVSFHSCFLYVIILILYLLYN